MASTDGTENATDKAEPWVCADCRSHFPFGQLKRCICTEALCPNCHSHRVCRADGIVYYADRNEIYRGKFGLVQ